jgi:hypothetical protein
MAGRLAIRVDAGRTPLVDKAVELLRRELRERSGHEAPRVGVGPVGWTLALDVRPGIGADGFRVEDAPGGARIVGNDDRGLLYGVGKFLRGCAWEPERVTPSIWRGTSVPKMPVRAMYFASHFHNFYHDAPIEKVSRYVEDLALWGCNALSVWFDMHHYQGMGDPNAQAMVRRLNAVLDVAGRVGIRAGLTMLANEAYANSPEALRADWTAGHDGYFAPPGGHYHVEICPNKPGGLDLILRWREEMLDAFAGTNPEYLWIWPYDQGGCTCSPCAPWGTNGFFKTAEPLARLIRRKFPQGKIILSTWYFDRFIRGEWEGLTRLFAQERPEWIDYLLIDDFGGFPEYPLQHGVPGGYPVVGFPEISMEGNSPWGGYGALPRPKHWQRYADVTRGVLSGSWPYSEGIFEDINKAMILQWEWSPDRTMDDIVREYATGYFGAATADGVANAAALMEEDEGTHDQGARFHTGPLARAEECRALVESLDRQLPAAVRRSWRWRLLVLRAQIDAELKRTRGEWSDALVPLMEELRALYHAEHAEGAVCPPKRP